MSATNSTKIAFIGAGNMASSIIGGLIQQGYGSDTIRASDPNSDTLKKLSAQFGIPVFEHNQNAIKDADVVVLAVKPQVMGSVCKTLAPHLPQRVLIISIAAGIDCHSLNTWLGKEKAVVRCMPNTPSLIGEGAAGLFATSQVSQEQRSTAEHIMSAVGSVCWVEEEPLLDAVTAVSGSGPAYFFLVIEAMTDAGVQQGLSKETAANLAIQTAVGAAKLAKSSDVDAVELRKRVTSPNGTTEKAIASFEKNDLRRIFSEAMRDCADRSKELSDELGAK